MASQNLQLLQEELQQEFLESIKNSKLSEVLVKYGIEGHHVLQVKCMLDLDKVNFTDSTKDKEFKEFIQSTRSESIIPVAERGICTTCDWMHCD
ncbi:hypothetical protein NUACC21_51660 [Scytonema sp. NUACC21]